MFKQYYLKTGITIVTETEETEQGELFWINPVEVMFMTQGTILRPLFSTTKKRKFPPKRNVLENDVLLEDELSERFEEDYRKNIADILEKMGKAEEERNIKESGLVLPHDMQRISKGNFRLPGPR